MSPRFGRPRTVCIQFIPHTHIVTRTGAPQGVVQAAGALGGVEVGGEDDEGRAGRLGVALCPCV